VRETRACLERKSDQCEYLGAGCGGGAWGKRSWKHATSRGKKLVKHSRLLHQIFRETFLLDHWLSLKNIVRQSHQLKLNNEQKSSISRIKEKEEEERFYDLLFGGVRLGNTEGLHRSLNLRTERAWKVKVAGRCVFGIF